MSKKKNKKIHPAMNFIPLAINIVIVLILYKLWLLPLDLHFSDNLCTPAKVQAIFGSIIVTIGIQIIFILFKEVWQFVSIKKYGVEIGEGGIYEFLKVFILWEKPNAFYWILLLGVLIGSYMLSFSPVSLSSTINPPEILEFTVDYQDGLVPIRVKNGNSVDIPIDNVVVVKADIPVNDVFSCQWITKSAKLGDLPGCAIKYSPTTNTTEFLKVKIYSLCSTQISEGSLIVQIMP